MNTTKKHIFTLFLSCFLFVSSMLFGHGFGPDTLVALPHSSHKTIQDLCLGALRNTISIVTYDMQNSCICNQDIKIGKRSKSNCYIKLGFGKQFNIHDDIVCTPSQEFYVPATGQWLPAYKIQPGDGLTTSHGTIQRVTYKEFVPKSHKVYMLEVEKTHIFFVSKYSILTHNIFLPAAAFVGISVPFGSAAATAIGSFFGTIGMFGGFTLGGLVGIAIQAIYENRVHRYRTPYYDNILIQNSCSFIPETNNQPKKCFESGTVPKLPSQHIFPIEYSSFPTHTGCIELDIDVLGNRTTYTYDQSNEQQKGIPQGCFQPIKHTEQLSYYSQEKPVSENPKTHLDRPSARNWKEFETNHPIGQQYGKKFTHTGKQNPKDGSPIRQLMEDIPNTEMFKRRYFFALDRFHDGDHFEVWDKNGNWIGVANLDGSKNEKKTNAEKDKPSRNIKNIL